MRRAYVLLVMGLALCIVAFGVVGCGSKTSAADAAKQKCFANQARISEVENLFHADSGEYAPVADVASKLGAVCPSKGTYSIDENTGQVSCSVHGSAPKP